MQWFLFEQNLRLIRWTTKESPLVPPYYESDLVYFLLEQSFQVSWWVQKESDLRPPYYQYGVLPLNYEPKS